MRVAIGAGGTGGHIYPGLAVAKALEEVTDGDVEICFISTKRGLQLTLVPQFGYELHTFDMVGLRGVKSALQMVPQLVRSGIGRLTVDQGQGHRHRHRHGRLPVGAGDGRAPGWPASRR